MYHVYIARPDGWAGRASTVTERRSLSMTRNRLPSPATVAVLRALNEGVTYGFDVMDATGLPSGTVYPILARLERRRLVASSWEDPAVHRDTGRPARKYYSLTDAGRTALEEATARYRALGTLRPEEA